jgi:glycosyltransferase involved in cell wall biosynthesis
MRILFVDPVTPKPYSEVTLRHEPLGGTEATVIRVAEYLGAFVIQHNRTSDEGRYLAPATDIDPTHVIILRDAATALKLRAKYPEAKLFLWLHDLAGPNSDRGKKLLSHAAAIHSAAISLICVSDFHRNEVRQTLAALPPEQRPAVSRIYNPVDVSAVPQAASEPRTFDPDKLVFFSAPHKGLRHAVNVFSYMHSKNGKLRLYLANPGYLPSQAAQLPGIINLGALPHHLILQHVSDALCTFFPNYVYPETFGLALTESNALGTPVLTHAIGAAPEVLKGREQFIDVPKCRGPADSFFWHFPKLQDVGEGLLAKLGCSSSYYGRIEAWREGGRPVVSGNQAFHIKQIGEAWKSMLATDMVSMTTAGALQ